MTTKEFTRLIVAGSIGICILIYVWIAPLYLWLKIVFTILGLWEAYTLVNKDKEDTLSEGIAYLAGISQLIPLLFGTVFGYALGAKVITDPIVASAFGGLLCHFFFSMKQTEAKVANEAIRQEGIIGGDRRDHRNAVLRMESKEGQE